MLELPGYKIEKQIGKGGMARVYLAVHEGLHREVAIKVMSKHLDEDSGFSERFMREARIVANLNHQNIVTVYDVNVYDGYHYIAMEYLPGGITLDHKIKQGISPQAVIDTIRQVASALGYAHGKGIVHRDVKPENIMYREDGSAVLTDFGIARSTTSATKMTATGTVIGTPHYMSPEQAQGQELGSFADIYSLGVVFYEALTGKVPYDADSSIAVVFKHITEPVPTLEGELAIYQPVLDRMMSKDKETRYQNCDEIIADINSLISGGDAFNATMINNATAINPAVQVGARQNKTTAVTGLQNSKPKNKFLIPAIAGGVLIIASAGAYVAYDQNRAAQEQQNIAQLRQQKEQALLAEKQRLEKIQAEEQQAKLKAQQLAEQKKSEAAEKLDEAAQLAAQKKAEEEKALQLAALERKKAEEARQTKLNAEREKARLAQQKKITDLFATAESQLLNTQLKSAHQSFLDILKLEPGNTRAQGGIDRVAERYLALAKASAIANDFEKANNYMGSVIQIAPTHPELGPTQQEIFALKDAQLTRQAEAQRAQQQTVSTPEEPEKKRRTFGGF